MLSEQFLSRYNKYNPFPNFLAEFVYYRTYSRFLEHESRKETWKETCKRTVEYSFDFVKDLFSREELVAEAEKLFENIYNLKQFPSGRTLWIGGTKAAETVPMANFNCSGIVIDDYRKIPELFYLLLVGAGVGFRILEEDVKKIVEVKGTVCPIHLEYEPKEEKERFEDTRLVHYLKPEKQDFWAFELIIGDSKLGWVQALRELLECYFNPKVKKPIKLYFNYNNVRSEGERLKTFGGKASGPEALKGIFQKIIKILDNFEKLTPINVLDICNIIGQGVVVGGVRRTSEIAIFSPEDLEMLDAKQGELDLIEEYSHRFMSNNSIWCEEYPGEEKIEELLHSAQYTGEPGIVNAKELKRRNKNSVVLNPCAETLLPDRGLCNLSTINIYGFVKDGKLEFNRLLEAFWLAVRHCLRIASIDLGDYPHPEWNIVQRKYKLIGVSITGWQDASQALKYSRKQKAELLRLLKAKVRKFAERYSEQLGIKCPELLTTIKPEGTLSLLAGVSPGVHHSHAPFYIRRVRINNRDDIHESVKKAGLPVIPDYISKDTSVVEFPVQSNCNKTKNQVSCQEQLADYLLFMENYVDHNVSITVHVKEHEWSYVSQWLKANWDKSVALTFIADDLTKYKLMPYEEISKQAYLERYNAFLKGVKCKDTLLNKFKEETELEVSVDDCVSGQCPVR